MNINELIKMFQSMLMEKERERQIKKLWKADREYIRELEEELQLYREPRIK